MSTNYKMWAPKCAYPTCNNKVGYHKRYPKLDKTMGFKWKIACEDHRKVKKWEFDAWKVALRAWHDRMQSCLDYSLHPVVSVFYSEIASLVLMVISCNCYAMQEFENDSTEWNLAPFHAWKAREKY